MRAIRSILYDLNIILAGIFIVFQILDIYNPKMNFIGNGVSRYLMFAFCALTIFNVAAFMIRNHASAKAGDSKESK